MKIVFIGAVKFSKLALEKIIDLEADVVGVCTLKESTFNSDFHDLTSIANLHKIPSLYVKDVNSLETIDWIKEKKPDFIFCFGFSRLLRKEILNLSTYGVVGYHPALLPYNRGRHPLIWALALGLKETGSTFFFMDEGADSGDILSQSSLKIDDNDNASSLYKKSSEVALEQIEGFLPQLQTGTYSRTRQDHNQANNWRKRTVKDGIIDWRMSATTIHNLVRALNKPYIGAHFLYEENEIKVWMTEIVDITPNRNIEPGKVIDKDDNGNFTIKCGQGSIKLTETEPKFDALIGNYL